MHHAESNLQQVLMISLLFCKGFIFFYFFCALPTQILVYFSQILSKEEQNCEVKKENARFTKVFFFFFYR